MTYSNEITADALGLMLEPLSSADATPFTNGQTVSEFPLSSVTGSLNAFLTRMYYVVDIFSLRERQ